MKELQDSQAIRTFTGTTISSAKNFFFFFAVFLNMKSRNKRTFLFSFNKWLWKRWQGCYKRRFDQVASMQSGPDFLPKYIMKVRDQHLFHGWVQAHLRRNLPSWLWQSFWQSCRNEGFKGVLRLFKLEVDYESPFSTKPGWFPHESCGNSQVLPLVRSLVLGTFKVWEGCLLAADDPVVEEWSQRGSILTCR